MQQKINTSNMHLNLHKKQYLFSVIFKSYLTKLNVVSIVIFPLRYCKRETRKSGSWNPRPLAREALVV